MAPPPLSLSPLLVSTAYNGHGSMPTRRTPTRLTFGPTPLSSQSLLRVPLIDSPLPSPSLPSILPRHGKRTRSRWRRRLRRLLFWVAGVSVIVWYCLSVLRRFEQLPAPLSYMSQDGEAYEILGSNRLPNTPTPILVTDQRGRSRWTIWMPPQLEYPLMPAEYSRICKQSTDLAGHIAKTKGSHNSAGHNGYYFKDPNFMDVPDAQRHGLLPADDHSSLSTAVVGGEVYRSAKSEDIPICEKSLTYVLQTEDAGFGATLMRLWLAYGLAQKERREFFIDDTNWAYGNYTTYFLPPPMPQCRPPPPSQRLPCPHQARHLLVSSSTTKWSLGHGFNDQFEDAHKMGVERQKPIFELAHAGYSALFHLSGDDATYLERRIANLRSGDPDDSGDKKRKADPMVVGIHVRRGDRHPFEFQYQNSYIPLDTYVQAAQDVISSVTHAHSSGLSALLSSPNPSESKIIIASDDPDVYSAPEAKDLIKAQRFISLASKSALDSHNPNANKNPLDTNIGWEGGFFSALFWSLGAPSMHHRHAGPLPSQRATNEHSSSSTPESGPEKSDDIADAEQRRKHFKFHPSDAALRLRELIGRAYLLDIAVLGSASDSIVCGVSSVTCRLLGVMMGWDAIIAGQRSAGGSTRHVWKNVDGDFEWKGIIW